MELKAGSVQASEDAVSVGFGSNGIKDLLR
jgi:hypothetical protein